MHGFRLGTLPSIIADVSEKDSDPESNDDRNVIAAWY